MLQDTADSVARAFKKRSGRFSFASRLIKVIFIAIATCLATVAQFMDFNEAGPSNWQLIGMGSAAVAFLGALFVSFVDQDASEELDIARRAIEDARSVEYSNRQLNAEFDSYEKEIKRAIELYSLMSAMRSVIEQIIASSMRDPVDSINLLLKAAKRSLPITIGFRQSDRWTICVYFADNNAATGRKDLRCIAHIRAIDCAIKDARIWQEGVGVGGTAYANNRETIVPDLLDEALGNVFLLSSKQKKSYDDERYRSIAAVPINVDHDERPWGVVIATTDRASHFMADDVPGVQTVEGVRALAGMVALAISVSRTSPREAGRPPA